MPPSQPELDFAPRRHAPGYADAMARKRDPLSSHVAADAAERSGVVACHEALILEALLDGAARNTTEIAERCGLEHVQVARRTKAMQGKRMIERVEPEGVERVRWRIA